MAAAAFFFSLMSLMVKGVGRHLPSQEIVLGRGALMVGLSYAAVRRARVSAWGHDRKLLALRCVFGFLALSSFFYALVHLPLAETTVIQYTNPVFTALMAAVALHEGIPVRQALSVALSLLGVGLIARPSFLFGAAAADLDPVAVGIALAGAVFSAAAYVSVRRLGRTDHPLVIVHWFAVTTVLGSLPLALPHLVWPTPWEWAALAAIALATLRAQVHMTTGLTLERAGRATAVGYLQIVLAGLWGLLFFGEIPNGWSLAGAALIIGATLWLARQRVEPDEVTDPLARALVPAPAVSAVSRRCRRPGNGG